MKTSDQQLPKLKLFGENKTSKLVTDGSNKKKKSKFIEAENESESDKKTQSIQKKKENQSSINVSNNDG